MLGGNNVYFQVDSIVLYSQPGLAAKWSVGNFVFMFAVSCHESSHTLKPPHKHIASTKPRSMHPSYFGNTAKEWGLVLDKCSVPYGNYSDTDTHVLEASKKDDMPFSVPSGK